jgi:hypothetical protein
MKVYAAEKEANLSEAIVTANKIVANCEVVCIKSPATQAALDECLQRHAELSKANEENFDLHPLYTILTTTGWNKNDDVFDRWETWAAKDTPEDKPFNLEHKPSDIIGHITGGWAVDGELGLISAAETVEDLPDQFHLLTSAVLYKHLSTSDKELAQKVSDLLTGIANNEWYVSMEALFSDFDYALVSEDGQQQVVARNEDTAFLTKHLRAYGGEGEFDGRRVGRLLRNITFSGKGLVKKPANPASVIFNDVNIFKGVLASFDEVKASVNLEEKKEMAEEAKLLDLERQNADLNDQIKSLRERLTKMDEEKVQAQIDGLNEEIAARDKVIAERDAKIEELTASCNEEAKAKEEAIATKADVEKELAEAKTKLDEIEAKSLVTARVSTLVDKGVDKADAEELVNKAGDMTDEQFELLVEAKAAAVKPEADGNDEEEQSEASEEETDEAGEEAAEAADLDSIEEDGDEVAMGSSTETDTDEVQATRAEIQSYLAEFRTDKRNGGTK